MKKTFLFSAVAAVVFSFGSCSKDDNPAPPGTATTFSPSTNGSTWTYMTTEQVNAENPTTDTVTLTATTATKTFSTRSYTVYLTNQQDSVFMTQTSNDYYRIQSFPTVGVNNFEELYLKDNANVNDTWSTQVPFSLAGSPFSGTANLTYTIKSKGQTMTVQGKSYDKVTYVHLDAVALSIPIGTGDFYYQQGVGLIKSTLSVGSVAVGGTYTTSQELLTSVIK